ncbi:sensor histidine kinase [Paenibacillus sp. MBLB4367]|uniref:cache domain-containing sensor histidine kinase n=1 Tax=Paenibacillus sp. MBLB4367 TaxID=3384767 RepID=UPI00390805CD
MGGWVGKSLKRKLSFLLLGSILLPLLLLGFVSYRIAASVTEEKAKESGMNTLRQLETNLQFMIQDVENMSIFLIGQRDFQRYLNGDEPNAVNSTLLIAFLSNLVFSKNYISDITIFPKDGSAPLSNMTIFQSGLHKALQQNPQLYEGKERAWTTPYENITASGLKRVVSLYRPIRNYNTFGEIGKVAISIDLDAVSKNLRELRLVGGGTVLLLGPDDRIISGGDDKWRNAPVTDVFPGMAGMEEALGSTNYGSGEQKKTILYKTMPNVGWKIVGIIPYNEYRAQNNYVLLLTAAAVGVAIMLIAGLVLFFVQRITKPLVALTHYLKDANPDNPMPTYEVTTPDEVGQLIRSYNKLSERIMRLKEQVMLNEALKKEADLQALQAQINPHFLYNTLSSIHWIALMNQDMKIAEMVGSLSDFLRFSLNKGEEFCPVRQEVAHAQNYARIQSIRFPDKFDIQFFIDPELEERPMLKLLLQPLIENAMIHGIQKKDGMGNIYVYGHLKDEAMRFVVEDTGAGMHASKLQEIRGQLGIREEKPRHVQNTYGSYGLRNVHQRLVLHYGDEAGLSIASEEGKGTRIEFAIPLWKEAAR